MAVLICLSFLLMSIVFPKSKLLNYAYFLFVYLLVGWNYSNGDYVAYERMYDNVIFDNFESFYEIGYKLLMVCGKMLNLSYQEFYFVIIIFPLFVVDRFFIKYSKYPFLCFALFSIVYLPLDYVLLRNFISFSFVLLGLEQVMENRKHSYWKYVGCVIVASTIHISSFFYLILFFGFNGRVQIKNVLFLVVAIFPVCLFLMRNVSVSEMDDRTDSYSVSIVYFLLLSSLQFLNLIIVLHYYKYKKMAVGELNRNDFIVLNSNILLLFLIVIYYFMGIFIRVFRHVSIINMVFFINIISCYHKSFHKNFLLLIILVIYLLYFVSFYTSTLDETLFSLFFYNIIFK